MILLVVGADRVDAGKTTFSAGLLERTGGVGYKPRAGNDYWFDHDDCRRALAEGRLFGKDAARLAAAEGRGRPPETLNPVHRLWRPSPGGGTGLLGRSDREFVVDRVGRPCVERAGVDSGVGDDGRGDRTVEGVRYVRNGRADLPDAVADALPLEDALVVESVEELNAVTERTYAPAFEALAAEIESADVAIVESYGDVAWPLAALDPARVAAVAAVEPGRARIYRGDRFARGCEVARSSPIDGALEKRVPDVIEYLEPVARVPLPPLPGEERTQPARIADAYADAYDALLEAAGAD
ncbi:ATPase [Natrialbaceae archaeon GCM10025810]|uniref:ATPase n=1 Tax=Halovalidus salilacus TaxID=3075124 RepID=UPI0036126549